MEWVGVGWGRYMKLCVLAAQLFCKSKTTKKSRLLITFKKRLGEKY